MRKAAEDAMLSHEPLYERAEVRKNKAAHAEFRRVAKLMGAIGKNDALYSSGLNTYCLLYAEIAKLESDRERIQAMMDKLMNKSEEICDPDELIQAVKAIDKENVMTVSAALRSIPKTPEKAVNPILAALSEDDEQHG